MKSIYLIAALTLISFAAGAQGYHAGQSYTSTGGANGFRTVSEENSYMEQVLADRRKKDREESDKALNNKQSQPQQREERNTDRKVAVQYRKSNR